MKLDNWFSNFQLDKIRLGPHGANAEITFIESDKEAAWELYLEMLTRIVTQPLRHSSRETKRRLYTGQQRHQSPGRRLVCQTVIEGSRYWERLSPHRGLPGSEKVIDSQPVT